jgi:phosphoribosylanthranilate isomerase
MNPAIKICGMRESENIKAAAELKPDFMGFIFYPESPRFAGELANPEIIAALPGEILKTGVFVNATFKTISEYAEKYSLNVVQLHGDEPPELCQRIKDTGIQVIKVCSIRKSMSFPLIRDYFACTDWLLFDTMTVNYGGSGQKFDWEILESFDPGHPFFLSGGISPGDAGTIAAISNISFFGVDLNSRFEIKPGLKDIDKLKKFINELRNKHMLL